MSARRVLKWMSNPRLCEQTGLSIPECCCRECCRALLWRYAPALLDPGPLDLPCPTANPPIQTVESYANAHGVSEHELWIRSSQIEVGV
jgi:hypothetical protein